MATPRIALTIAGHDPSSGAGVTADLQVFAAHGVFGASCITALTAQSTVGVKGIAPTDSAFLAECLSFLANDLPISGVKIGMLGTADAVRVVSKFVSGLAPGIPVVLDPVICSSSGRELLPHEGVEALLSSLIPRATWITPNHAELALLLRESPHTQPDAIAGATRRLASRFPSVGIIATGGESDPPADFVLLPGEEGEWITGEHVSTRATHGTGCAFSSSLLCGLLDEMTAIEAARAAKRYVQQAMRTAPGVGHGKGPMNLLWPLQK